MLAQRERRLLLVQREMFIAGAFVETTSRQAGAVGLLKQYSGIVWDPRCSRDCSVGKTRGGRGTQPPGCPGTPPIGIQKRVIRGGRDFIERRYSGFRFFFNFWWAFIR